MSLCMLCGKIEDHARGCAQGPKNPTLTPEIKNERALQALAEVQTSLPRLQALVATSPREATFTLWSVERTLERRPSGDLSSFEKKRLYKQVEDSVNKVKTDLGPAADGLLSDLTYTKKALELLHAAVLRRREVASVKLQELTVLPTLGYDPQKHSDPTDPGESARMACELVEKRLATTLAVDADVDAWGKAYVELLATGELPTKFPGLEPSWGAPIGVLVVALALVGGGAAVFFGKLAGDVVAAALGGGGALLLIVAILAFARTASTARAVPARFSSLAERFRERLFLVCVSRSLGKFVSNLSQAEEALRAHVGGDNAARWKRIKTSERDLVKALAGNDWDEKVTVDEEMARRIAATGRVAADAIVSPGAVARTDWEGLGKTYVVDRHGEDSDAANDARLAAFATAVLERAGAQDAAVAGRERSLAQIREVWSSK